MPEAPVGSLLEWSGLNGGERVVLDPPANLEDGAQVRVVEANGTREGA